MRYVLALVAITWLAACPEHGKSPSMDAGDDGVSPPDAEPRICPVVSCAGHDCISECSPPVAGSCAAPCHASCVTDECAGMPCGPNLVCVQACTYDCSGFAWTCGPATCVAPTDPVQCEALHDESSCLARSDCNPIYEGSGCFCPQLSCSCADQKAVFRRCRTPST